LKRLIDDGHTWRTGHVLTAEGEGYEYEHGAESIPDLPNVKPQGNVASFRQFGAKGDAVVLAGALISGTDDTEALQAALDWQQAAPGRILMGHRGDVHLVTDTLTGAGADVFLYGRGARFFKNTSGNVWYFPPATIQYFDLSADYTAGDLDISVETTGAALDVGQPAIIVSDAVSPINRDSGDNDAQYRTAEWVFAAVGTTPVSIRLQAPLARVVGIDPELA
ncbi:unnamed protein product, partial [Ectocarpus sp. 12 AP-2014]